MAKNIFKILAVFILGVSGGILSDLVLRPYFFGDNQGPVYVTERKEIIIQENTALTGAIEKAEKTSIKIKTITQEGDTLEGLGLILTSDGLVVTLNSLVPKGSKFIFFVEEAPVSFQILKRDIQNDLALVKIEGNNLTTAGFGDLGKIKIGERVFLSGQSSANSGIIRNFDNNLIETNIVEEKRMAGTPLFNIEGQVLGINKIDSRGKVGAIPVSKIKEFTGL